MISGIELVFCTYFKRIERFRYDCETYGESVAFCVKQGSFACRIGEEKEERIVSEGELIICPPGQPFHRKILEPLELCMIKFHANGTAPFSGKTIQIANILRWNEDLGRLEGCLFCDTMSDEPLWAHCCMDILYIAMDSMNSKSTFDSVKQYMERNFHRDVRISALADQAGYAVPYFISRFRQHYGVTPKVYLSKIRIQKAKELLLSTDMLSREIADTLGFADELYFIRFFKKHTGLTPQQFRRHSL